MVWEKLKNINENSDIINNIDEILKEDYSSEILHLQISYKKRQRAKRDFDILFFHLNKLLNNLSHAQYNENWDLLQSIERTVNLICFDSSIYDLDLIEIDRAKYKIKQLFYNIGQYNCLMNIDKIYNNQLDVYM